MKNRFQRSTFLVVVMILLQSCSMSDVLPFLSTPVPKSTLTPLPTSTSTPTLTHTPRASATPTIYRVPTRDPNLTESVSTIDFDFSFGNEIITNTPRTPPSTFSPGVGFSYVTVSDGKIFWGDCTPNKTTIVAQVEDPDEVTSVIIFNRVKSAIEDDYTPWTNGNVMFNNQNGRFSYIMKATELDGHNHYRKSWVQFQLVATNIRQEEVGRTTIFENMIFLEPCLCYEPLKGCPINTPKPVKTTKP